MRSPVASGRIVRITAPDGANILTAAELAGARPIRPMLHKFDYRPIEQPLLAKDVVRFVGEPVAAVYAPTAAEAEDFADRVDIEIEELPAVIDARAALAPDAPRVHEHGNVVVDGNIKTADFDATLAKAHRRIRLNLRSRRQNATPLEARAAHAAFDPATGRTTLTCTTQMPHLTRTAIADILGFAESDLRVIAPDVGGGFGQKMSLAAEYVVLVWLARKLQDSVAWNEDRRENLIAAFHSRDQHVELEGGFDARGKLIALSADVIANIGAYSCFPTTCGVEPLMALAELPGPYDVRAYCCRARGVATHTCTMAPYRGVSRPVITFAVERLMDKAAAEFGLSPVEIRRRNLIARFPYTSATGLVFDEGSYIETLDKAAAHVDLPAFRVRQTRGARRRPPSRHRLCDVFRAHRLWQPGIRRARHGDHAGLGKRRGRHGPVGPRRSAHRREPARPGLAHDAGADRRRSARRRAGRRARVARRYRSHALWLGHLRQPVARHLRRRHAPGGAKNPRKTSRHRRRCSGSGARTISCWKTAAPKSRAPIARSRSPRWRAPPITRRIASRASRRD